METRLKFCSNKALVAFMVKHGVKPKDIALGYNDTLLFAFDPVESQPLYDIWVNQKNDQD